MKYIRFLGNILSWIAALSLLGIGIGFFVLGFLKDHDAHETINALFNWVTGVLSFIKPIQNFLQDNSKIMGPIIGIIAIFLGIILFFIIVSQKKISNIIEILLGIIFLLFINWISAIFLIIGGSLKLFTSRSKV